jgi:hypothetical protein
VVTNTGTALARRRLPTLRSALPESAALRHQVTQHQSQADVLLGHADWQRDDLLVINGGDGSVQHALTVLLANCPSDRLPRLACLPGGSTNMTAFDINVHRGYSDCVATLRELVSGRRLTDAPRPVVQVFAGDATAPRAGLFFGVGTIVQGIEYFQQRLRGDGGRHELAAGVALARTLWGIARQQPPFALPLQAAVCAPGLWPDGRARELSLRLLLATTLNRLFLGIRPFWGMGHGALKTTLVERRAPAFLRRVPRLLRGRPDGPMTAAEGYCSGTTDLLTVRLTGSFTLDGELFACAGDTMRVQSSEAVRFVPL